MMMRRPVAALAVVLPLVAAVPALAQGTDAQRAACGGDAFRLCASSMPNADKVAACLRREKEQLSPACRSVFEAAEGGGSSGAAVAAKPDAAKPAPTPPVKDEPKAEPTRSAQTQAPAEAKRTPPAEKARAGKTAASPKPVARSAPRTAAPAQRASVRTPLKQAAGRPATTRQTAARRNRIGRENADFAQANYWMKRVTGLSIGHLAGLIPN